MNPIRHYCFIAAVLLSNFLYGQSNEKITEAFFKTYKENPTKAYGNLFENNKWMKDKKAILKQ